jgi:hypothetical protein
MLLRRRLVLTPFLVRRLLPRRLLIGGGVLVILLVGGSALIRDARGTTDGPATGASATGPSATSTPATTETDSTAVRMGVRPRLGRHVVHAVVTVDRDGELVTFQVDRGTIGAVGDGKLTISETGGGSVTVATNDQTRVRRDRKKITLADLNVGDGVYVISKVPANGGPLAVRIAAPTGDGGPT